jgi:hypothetical protein
MFVFVFICCIGLCDGLITSPKEFYQVSTINYETSGVRRPRSFKDYKATDDDDDSGIRLSSHIFLQHPIAYFDDCRTSSPR